MKWEMGVRKQRLVCQQLHNADLALAEHSSGVGVIKSSCDIKR